MNVGFPIFWAQTGVALASLVGFAFAPPDHGRMLLLPLTDAAAAEVPSMALDRHALLVAPGPIRGSLVVIAERGGLERAALAKGILVLSAPSLLCGQVGEAA